LIDGQRQSAFGVFGLLDCRVGGWPSASALSPKGWLAVMSIERRSYRAAINSNSTPVSALTAGTGNGFYNTQLRPCVSAITLQLFRDQLMKNAQYSATIASILLLPDLLPAKSPASRACSVGGSVLPVQAWYKASCSRT
jgi:hypothetical protein